MRSPQLKRQTIDEKPRNDELHHSIRGSNVLFAEAPVSHGMISVFEINWLPEPIGGSSSLSLAAEYVSSES